MSILNVFDKPYGDTIRPPLVDSPWPLTIIITSYMLFIFKYGRQFMANREPFHLKKILQVYNLMQVIFNTIMFVSGFYFLFIVKPYDFSCMKLLPQDHPAKWLERLTGYMFFVNKVLDLLDTVFFVLRKSYKQVTVLHVVHHVIMSEGGFLIVRFYGFGGHLGIMGICNTFVHILMYSYYYLASQNANIKNSLGFKKSITKLQLLQFFVILGHTIWSMMQPNCGVPGVIFNVALTVSVLMIVMFSNFYYQAYILPEATKPSKKD